MLPNIMERLIILLLWFLSIFAFRAASIIAMNFYWILGNNYLLLVLLSWGALDQILNCVFKIVFFSPKIIIDFTSKSQMITSIWHCFKQFEHIIYKASIFGEVLFTIREEHMLYQMVDNDQNCSIEEASGDQDVPSIIYKKVNQEMTFKYLVVYTLAHSLLYIMHLLIVAWLNNMDYMNPNSIATENWHLSVTILAACSLFPLSLLLTAIYWKRVLQKEIIAGQPSFQEYCEFKDRLDTFSSWRQDIFEENGKNMKKNLAEEGFFFHQDEDCVRCHFCGNLGQKGFGQNGSNLHQMRIQHCLETLKGEDESTFGTTAVVQYLKNILCGVSAGPLILNPDMPFIAVAAEKTCCCPYALNQLLYFTKQENRLKTFQCKIREFVNSEMSKEKAAELGFVNFHSILLDGDGVNNSCWGGVCLFCQRKIKWSEFDLNAAYPYGHECSCLFLKHKLETLPCQ